MPEWNTAAKLFIDDSDDETLAVLKPDAINRIKGLNDSGRDVFAKLNPRRSPMLGNAIYEVATGSSVAAFLAAKPYVEPTQPPRVPYVDAIDPDDFAEGMQ